MRLWWTLSNLNIQAYGLTHLFTETALAFNKKLRNWVKKTKIKKESLKWFYKAFLKLNYCKVMVDFVHVKYTGIHTDLYSYRSSFGFYTRKKRDIKTKPKKRKLKIGLKAFPSWN